MVLNVHIVGYPPVVFEDAVEFLHGFAKIPLSDVFQHRMGPYEVDRSGRNRFQALKACGQIRCVAPFKHFINCGDVVQVGKVQWASLS